ncbi:MAG TPA: NUDIX domain-containing protein [Naasia sp.]|jgi:predicted NUDIX family NTP pyrophosphohydrolase
MAGPKRSAGILLYRRSPALEVLVGHPGGPFWAKKDAGAWSIPKGELEEGEDPLDAAVREFGEELGLPVPVGPIVDLGEVAQNHGKVVRAFAVEGDLDPDAIVPGTFELAWPPRSGRTMTVPEIDRVAWCTPDEAREKLLPGQRPLLDRLEDLLADG